MAFIFPFSGSYKVTSSFGTRNAPTAGASTDHKGLDFGVPLGTNILAADAGTVAEAGYSSSRGNYVIIDHGAGLSSVYEHLSAVMSKKGDTVQQGQTIGSSGSTGISTGPHLHFEIRQNGVAVDPLQYLSGSSGVNMEKITKTADNVLDLVKQYWYLIAGGLIAVALIDSFKD